jgi:hypothetical protein
VRERKRGLRATSVVVAVLSVGVACSSTTSESAPSTNADYRVEALSTRPDYVSGGDVLVGIGSPTGQALDGLRVTLGDRDLTSAFTLQGDRLVGLVSGLPDGTSTVSVEGDGDTASLDVVNHPITGPMFSGPHLDPFICKTEQFGLGAPTDDNCSAPTKVEDQDVGGVATTVERGVIDRSIYTVAFPKSGWNGRLVYRFGGGCGTTYSQGTSFVNAVDPTLLQKGYAAVTSTLNTYQSVCNEVLSAEVALMVKEHFIETYGLPEFTIGEGGSGGAIQQIQIAQNYPGILDAIAPAVPFADAISTAQTVTDCGLLLRYYATPAGSQLDAEQQRAISGHRSLDTCRLWSRSFLPNIDPAVGCDPAIPREEIYDSGSNRDGVRCTLQDGDINLYGVDPTTGFATRPLDNEGVIYGWQAFNDGVVSFDQLVDLNQNVGGYNIDGQAVAERETGPDEWFERAYATGRVSEAGGLVDIPIILTNVYTDALGDIHDRQRAFSVRQRLGTAAGAEPDNVAIFTLPGSGNLNATLTGAVGDTSATVALLDQWLTAAKADAADGTNAERLARRRPPGAVDTCVLADGQKVSGDGIYDAVNACTQEYPVAADARRVAGAPLRDDLLKCTTRPIDTDVFTRPVTDEQLDRLRAVFPDGVCDWSAQGVGQVPLEGTWLTFDRVDAAPS